jgi:UDP-glucuronate decarboxylase
MKSLVDGKIALVAGGAGFVGSHLCDALLAEGMFVVCVDSFLTGLKSNVAALENNPRFRLVEHDISHPLEQESRFDEIYNLACAASPARYQADPPHTMMTSVAGTYHLLSLAELCGARFLLASTSEVYGDPEAHPQREDYRGNVSCTGPRACYDEGKRAAEALAFDFLRLGRADARVARIFNTFGPRMRADDGRIVSNFIAQALRGRPLTIYGDGMQTRSFCYVSDLVAGLIALMRAEPNPESPVNLGNPEEHTVLEFARIVGNRVGSAGMEYRPLPVDDPRRRRPDIGLAESLLDWSPRVSLEDGLERTIDWFIASGFASIDASPGGDRSEPAVAEVA